MKTNILENMRNNNSPLSFHQNLNEAFVAGRKLNYKLWPLIFNIFYLCFIFSDLNTVKMKINQYGFEFFGEFVMIIITLDIAIVFLLFLYNRIFNFGYMAMSLNSIEINLGDLHPVKILLQNHLSVNINRKQDKIITIEFRTKSKLLKRIYYYHFDLKKIEFILEKYQKALPQNITINHVFQ